MEEWGREGGGEREAANRQTEKRPMVLMTEVIKSRTCTKRLKERERERGKREEWGCICDEDGG